MAKQRQSNFELLRIVAMFFIVTHHLIIKGASTCGYMQSYNFERDGCVGLFINGLVVGGVNLFILISGYFGIKQLVKPILKLVIDLVVYGIIAYLIGVAFLNIDFNLNGLVHSIDIRNWFVVQFVLLIFMSPMLEATLNGQSRVTLGKWVGLLLIVNVCFGYFLGYVNSNGYNYLNFIQLYVIARYIRLMKEEKTSLYVHITKYAFFYLLVHCY